MIQVVREQKGSISVYKLSGNISEDTHFDDVMGPSNPEMEINCKGILRINSMGVKAWIKYFQTCQKSGTKLNFSECSTAIVEQINLISNFTCGGTVESIYLPFSCLSCKTELSGLFKTEDLKKMKMNLPTLKCTKCSGKAEFDDIPEDYLAFLGQ